MIDLRAVLCPVDFSEGSRRALAQAAALARLYDARLTVLYVSPLSPVVGGYPPMISPAAVEPLDRERLLEDLRTLASPLAAGVKTDLSLREGGAATEILEQARADATGLIVMGTHGRSGFERLVLGSVAEKVLRKAPCPVLTVSSSAEGAAREPGELRRILCAVDFSGPARDALRYAVSLAERAHAALEVVHVLDWPEGYPPHDRGLHEDALRKLDAVVTPDARERCDLRATVVEGKAWREILRVAATEGADLIAIGVHGHGAVDRLLFGSTVDHVVREASCAVLTVRALAASADAPADLVESGRARPS